MLIGLHDAERDHMPKKTFPNYALMKISAWHKAQGDTVEWWNALRNAEYDRVYSSKVFDFTPDNDFLPPQTIRGGTGYGVKDELPPEIDATFPDYSIYPDCDYAIGFITRGCPNDCPWCYVPEKEGRLHHYRTIEQIRRPDTDKVILMDNNVLAAPDAPAILEAIAQSGLRVDFNQGLDARLVTGDIAELLARIKWLRYIRFSCDTKGQINDVIYAVRELTIYNGIAPSRIFIYLLVTADLEDAAFRVNLLRQLGAITIYGMPYRDERKGITPNQLQKYFAGRYIFRGIWRKETWREYLSRSNYEK